MPPIDVISAQERIVLRLRELYEGCGYARFPMRRFEEYALYSENKSFLKSERVLSFTDANGRLMALKPDVTLSIVKRARADKNGVEKLYYNESVYRASPTDHEFAEIEQIGLEYLGEVDAYAVSEVLWLAILSLGEIGLPFALDIGHMGIAGELMNDADLSPERREIAFKLIRQKNAHELREALTAWRVAPIYLERIAALPTLCGSLRDAIPLAAELAVGAGMKRAVGELSHIEATLEALGLCEHVRLDLSIVNDLDYYNGLVFQGYVEGAPRVVLSGGRYDNLLRRLGKAGDGLGFAMYLGELDRALSRPRDYDADALLLYGEGDAPAKVLALTDELRRGGARVLALKEAPRGLHVRRAYKVTAGGLEEVRDDA